MIDNLSQIPHRDLDLTNIKNNSIFSKNKTDSCPNCGNTSPIFQYFQNGMLVCFICRKATINEKNFVASF